MAKFNIRLFHDGKAFSASIYDGGRSVAPIDVSGSQAELHALFEKSLQAWSLLGFSSDVSTRKRRSANKLREGASDGA